MVSHELPDPDRVAFRETRADAEAANVGRHRLIDIEAPGVREAKGRHRSQNLGDGPRAIERVGCRRDATRFVGKAETRPPNHLLIVDDDHAGTHDSALAQFSFDERHRTRRKRVG